MDLAALKNLDVKDIIEKIMSGGGADILKNKKLLVKFRYYWWVYFNLTNYSFFFYSPDS